MIARIPVKVHRRDENEIRGPTGKFLTVGTEGAELGDPPEGDVSEDSMGILPDGFSTVAPLADPIIDAVEDAGYDADDYEVEVGRSRVVLWAVVLDDPRDAEGDEWIRFEDE